MPVIAGNILRVTAFMKYGSDAQQNVWYIKSTNPTTITDAVADTAIIAWMDNMYGYLVNFQSTGLTYMNVGIQNISEGTPTRYAGWTTLTTGNDGTEVLPLQSALLVTFNTNVLKSQMRKYFGGFTIAATTYAGILETGAVLAAGSVITVALVGPNISGSFAQVGAYRASDGRFAPIQSGIVNGVMRTQRRRVIGVGS